MRVWIYRMLEAATIDVAWDVICSPARVYATYWQDTEPRHQVWVDLHNPDSIPRLKEFLEDPTKFPSPPKRTRREWE